MRAARFFREAATLEVAAGRDGYGELPYGSPASIKVRWFTENELVRNPDGAEVTTGARISTTASVALGDRITDAAGTARTVVQVRTNRDTKGSFSHRVAWLA